MFKPQSMRAGDSSVKAITDFTGDWFWESVDTTKSFKINLIRLNDSVYGQYCAAYDKGNRLDCEFNTSYNMFGHKVGDSIVLKFKTFYGGKNGEAVLKPEGKSLSWRISRPAVGGDCFAPVNAVMFRSIKNW
jgi:hypothetical protein